MRHRKLLVLAIVIMGFWFLANFVAFLLLPSIGPFAYFLTAILLFVVGYLVY
jgi:hypothetical protein